MKGEIQDEHVDNIEEVSDPGSGNEVMLKEKADSESSGVDVGYSEEGGSEPKADKRNEYLENKKKNMAELQKKLEEVKVQFLIPDDPISGKIAQKQAPKQPASKKKAPSDEPVVRRESQRNKDKRWVSYCDGCDDSLTTCSLQRSYGFRSGTHEADS